MSYQVNAYGQEYQLNFGDVFTDGFQYAICVSNDIVIHISEGDKRCMVTKCKFNEAFINSYDIPYKDKRYKKLTDSTYQILHQMLISDPPSRPISPHILFRDCHSVVKYIMTWNPKPHKSLPLPLILIPAVIITGCGWMMKMSIPQILEANALVYIGSAIILNCIY